MKRKSRNRKPSQELAPPAEGKTKLSELLEIPAAALAGTTQMEISGNREVVVDGCQGVLAYDEHLIRLAAGGMIITYTGRGLQIKVLTHTSAIIGGFITNIEFST